MNSQESRRTLARPSVDFTDDEDVNTVVELPQAESTTEENKDSSKKKKNVKKGKK